MPGLVINTTSVVKVIKGGENIISNGLCWVSVKFLVSDGVVQMFLNLVDVKEGVYEVNPAVLIERFDD